MEYLSTNATASPTGVFVLCRYLSDFEEGLGEEELRQALQVIRTTTTGSDEVAAVFTDSLAVASGLGIVIHQKTDQRWAVAGDFREDLRANGDAWPWFRGFLLHRITQQGLVQLESDRRLPDLVLAAAWLQQIDPLKPLALVWGDGPEATVRGLNLAAPANATQWRPFQRWMLALGLARRVEVGDAKVLVPDATTAISDQLGDLPSQAPADMWLEDLRRRLPLLGAAPVLDQLPSGNVWAELPAGVTLGLLKLEKLGRLALEPSDDATHVVPVGLGPEPLQVGRIVVRSAL